MMRARVVGLGSLLVAAVGLWAAPAQAVPNGLVIRVGLDGGYLWWFGEHEHDLSAPGQSTRLDRQPHGTAPAIGGRLEVGWKLVLRRRVGLLPRLGLAYARPRPETSRLNTELQEYEFELDATWASLDLGTEVQLFGEVLTASGAIGLGEFQSAEVVRSFASSRHETSTSGYVLRTDVGLRAPPDSFVAGGLCLAFEVFNFDPLGKLWSREPWSRATRLMLMARVEFDGVHYPSKAHP